jgi:digeranylgeranylglycerophospholipid reductase
MMSAPDVIVVGAGPCGSAAAAKLAKQGARVTIFEEHATIGVPSHCAGHLSISGLKRLGLFPLPRGIVNSTVSGVTVYSPAGNAFTIRFSSPVTYVVNRTLFDQLIAEIARASGACYCLQSRVESLIIKDGSVRGVNVNRKERTEKVAAKIVVDGEGISSSLLQQAGLQPAQRSRIINAVSADVEGAADLQPDMVEAFLGGEYAPGFYAWLIPTGENTARIGLATKENNPKELLQRLMLKHPSASVKLRRARILQTAFHPLTLGGPIPRLFSGGFLAVGDAASQVKPTTGGGVILGMTCAEIAAQVASESLQDHDFSAEFLSLYQKRCKRVLGLDMNIMLRIRRMLDVMSDHRVDRAIAFCKTQGLDKTLQNVKELDFQGKSLLRSIKSPKMVALLGYLLYSYLTANT